ncbi:MAG: TetR/AcrR family transcriptional regulator [Actinomycetia bacterium]|nr:TetR/AcrR family transcriptional regulator [Actinomycetes bacterium]MCP4086949.1 TetR/AcrR family transcriptional regulator [Actinomycetes bacterium]
MTTARLPAPERRRQLLDVAIKVFGERGFHNTSMNDVATEAGITKPVLYQHFASKRDLYAALLEAVGVELLDRIGEAVANATRPKEMVDLGFGAWFRFVAEEPAAFALLFSGDSRQDPEFALHVAGVEQQLADTIVGLLDIPELDREHRRLLAHGIMGISEAVTRNWLSLGATTDHEELARTTSALAWYGLRGAPQD